MIMVPHCSWRTWLAIASIVVGLATASAPANSQSEDETFGLPEGKGRDEVIIYCVACHSMNLVSQQRLPRYRWEELLVVMTEKNDMPKLPPEEEAIILDYLSKHLGPPPRRRRF